MTLTLDEARVGRRRSQYHWHGLRIYVSGCAERRSTAQYGVDLVTLHNVEVLRNAVTLRNTMSAINNKKLKIKIKTNIKEILRLHRIPGARSVHSVWSLLQEEKRGGARRNPA